jgi:hypothetical protein
MKKLLLKVVSGLTLLTQATSSFACDINGQEGIAPTNSMRIPVNSLTATMNEETFNAVLDHFESIYGPIVASMGQKLVVRREWLSDTVNAFAEQFDGNYNIEMHGGLARHPEATPDALANVVCHEMGHHIGGAPKRSSFDWASNEGQSDFFANTKCMRKYFARDNNREIMAGVAVPEKVVLDCAASFPGAEEEQAICQRGAMSGLALAKLLHSLGDASRPVPAFDTPDLSVVRRTNHNHPQAQCRLDTYYAGSLCEIPDSVDPVMRNDERTGFCMNNTHARGFRPACWYKEVTSVGDFLSRR